MKTILSLFLVLLFATGCGGDSEGGSGSGSGGELFEDVADCIAERYSNDPNDSTDVCYGTELPEGETTEYFNQQDPALSLYINGRFSLHYKRCNYVSEGDYVYRDLTGDDIYDCFCVELDEFRGTVACSSYGSGIPCRSCFAGTSRGFSGIQEELKHFPQDVFNSLLSDY